MDNIILKDSTVIEIEESSNGGSFRKRFENPADYLITLDKLTQTNLSTYQVQNSEGLVCGNPVNKECLTQSVTAVRAEDGSLVGLDVTFNITDVNMMAETIKGLLAGQEMNTDGIIELANIIGGEK